MWEPKTFQIWDVLSVLSKDFAHWRREQIPVELPMEAPRSHSQDTAYELLHTVDPGTEIPRPLLVDLNKSRILQPLFYPWVHTQIFFSHCGYCLPFRIKCQSHGCIGNLSGTGFPVVGLWLVLGAIQKFSGHVAVASTLIKGCCPYESPYPFLQPTTGMVTISGNSQGPVLWTQPYQLPAIPVTMSKFHLLGLFFFFLFL